MPKTKINVEEVIHEMDTALDSLIANADQVKLTKKGKTAIVKELQEVIALAESLKNKDS